MQLLIIYLNLSGNCNFKRCCIDALGQAFLIELQGLSFYIKNSLAYTGGLVGTG